tara:strand:- start:212 stop:481 length:270 start_codon:yes stop_codon:yes gene_type:complete
MFRIFLIYILPIILPSLLFFCWAKFIKKNDEVARTGPWFQLLLFGLSLMALGLVITAITGGMSPDGDYRAPYSLDGKIIPGQMIPKDKS